MRKVGIPALLFVGLVFMAACSSGPSHPDAPDYRAEDGQGTTVQSSVIDGQSFTVAVYRIGAFYAAEWALYPGAIQLPGTTITLSGDMDVSLVTQDWLPGPEYAYFLAFAELKNEASITFYFYKQEGGDWLYVMEQTFTGEDCNEEGEALLFQPSSLFAQELVQLLQSNGGTEHDLESLIPVLRLCPAVP